MFHHSCIFICHHFERFLFLGGLRGGRSIKGFEVGCCKVGLFSYLWGAGILCLTLPDCMSDGWGGYGMFCCSKGKPLADWKEWWIAGNGCFPLLGTLSLCLTPSVIVMTKKRRNLLHQTECKAALVGPVWKVGHFKTY